MPALIELSHDHSLYLFFSFFLAITPKAHGSINPTLGSQRERGVPVKLKESGEKINPRWSVWLDQQLFDLL